MADKKVSVEIGGKVDQFVSSMNKVDGVLGGFESKIGLAKKALGGLAAIAGAGSLTALVKESIDSADSMSKLSQKVGVNISQLTGMAYAADLADVSTEQLAKGMGKLAKGMFEAAGDGKSDPAKLFRDLGIAVTDSAGQLRGTDEVMMDVADRFAGMQDGAAKTALAIKIFGKSGADLIPLLNAGKQGIKESTDEAKRFGIVLSEEAGKRAEEFNDNLTRLKTKVSGVGMTIANDLVPYLNDLIDRFAKSGDISKSPFMVGLNSVKAEFYRIGMLADKVGGTLTSVGMLLYGPGSAIGYKPSKERFEQMAKWNMMFEDRYKESEKALQTMANLEVGLDANGNPIKAKIGAGKPGKDSFKPTGSATVAKNEEDAYLRLVEQSHDKYLSYSKAFDDRQAALAKIGYTRDADLLKEQLDRKLLSNKSYYEEKLKLDLDANRAEVDAKAKAVSALGEEAFRLEGTGDTAKYYEVMEKLENAKLALQQSLAERDKIDRQGAGDIRKGTLEDTQAQLSASLDLLTNKEALVDMEERYYKITTGEAAKHRVDLLTQEIAIHEQRYRLIEGNEPEAESQRLQELRQIQEKNALLLEQNRIITEKYGTAFQGLQDGLDRYERSLPSTFEEMGEFAEGTARAMEDSFGNLFDDVLHGKLDSFSDFFDSVLDGMLKQLSNLMAQMTMNSLFGKDGGWGDMLSGLVGSVSGLFGGSTANIGAEMGSSFTSSGGYLNNLYTSNIFDLPGRASGGPVYAGDSYWVGEKGIPEIFTPGASGFVTPLSKLSGAGGSGDVNSTVIVNMEGETMLKAMLRRALETEVPGIVTKTIKAHS